MAKTAALRTAWTAIGVLLFYFVLNGVVRAWQWPLALPGIGFEKTTDPYAAALIAVPPGLVLLILLVIFGASHASSVTARGILARLPQPFGLGDSYSVLLHSLQLAMFLAIPVICLFALTRKFLSGQFCERVASAAPVCGVLGARIVGNWSGHFKYVSLAKAFREHAYFYQGGIDYWPFWLPTIIAALWVVAIAGIICFGLRLFRRA